MVITGNYVHSNYSSIAGKHQIILHITGFFCLHIEMLPSNSVKPGSNQMFGMSSGDAPDFYECIC